MPVNFELYQHPQFGARVITESWLEHIRGTYHELHRPERQFARLMFLWTAFNAWGMSVTLAINDGEMVRIIGDDLRCEALFHRLVDGRMRMIVERYEMSFPLYNYADLLLVDSRFDWRQANRDERRARVEMYTGKRRVRKSPQLNPRNLVWSDMIACIYKIRCNLVHGGKIADRGEAEFVGAFADILERLLLNDNDNLLTLRERNL